MSGKLPGTREYGQPVLDAVSRGALDGLTPTRLATMLNLTGISRQNFLSDITNPVHPIGKIYRQQRDNYNMDIDTRLQMLQLEGDTDAMAIAMAREQKEYIARIKEDLFGL